MRDEFEMRLMDEHRTALATWIGDAVDSVAYTLDRLHAMLFDAPWRADTDCTV